MNRRKKASKYRGSKTHGGGSMKKRRGAGHRGGRGRAGSGKKGDSKRPKYWKESAKKGFYSVRRASLKTVNISQIDENSPKGGEVDLKALGFDKLLGTGSTKKKFMIKVDYASAGAVKKVEAAGGKVTLLKGPAEPKAKPVAKPEVKEAGPEQEAEPHAEESAE